MFGTVKRSRSPPAVATHAPWHANAPSLLKRTFSRTQSFALTLVLCVVLVVVIVKLRAPSNGSLSEFASLSLTSLRRHPPPCNPTIVSLHSNGARASSLPSFKDYDVVPDQDVRAYVMRPSGDGIVANPLTRFQPSIPLVEVKRRENYVRAEYGPEDVSEEEAKAAITRLGRKIGYDVGSFEAVLAVNGKNGNMPLCRLVRFGKGWGEHKICEYTEKPKDCISITFGVGHDYGFETDVVEKLGCTVFAMDPTTTKLPAMLGPKIHFMAWAAPTIRKVAGWVEMGAARIALALKAERIAVLKMDCEGCEYALYHDVMSTDPSFFHRVDQFAVELHLPVGFMRDLDAMLDLGRLFVLLERAGLEFMEASVTSLSAADEMRGCVRQLVELGFLCDKQRTGHNLLFARRASLAGN